MKFGKNIGRVVELSDPEWSPFWMNYKFLKKKVKALAVPSAKLDATPDLRCDPQALARSAGEVEFYKLLRQELRKCSDFFTSVESQFMVRQARVKEGWRQLLLPNIIVDGNPGKRLMAACVKLYKDLLLLENFAIMNYCGFSKILKKHDKVTGFRTRESFMKNVVNQAPFVEYPRLIDMLSSVEALFKDIESMPSASAEAGTRVPLREEQLFIDTMLTINTEAFRLQQEEGADIGLNTPKFSHKRDSLPKMPTAISKRVAGSHSKTGNGLDMVAAAAAQVMARAREAEKEEMAEIKHAGEPAPVVGDVDGATEPLSSSLAPVAEGCSNGDASSVSHMSKDARGAHPTPHPPAKRLCTNSR